MRFDLPPYPTSYFQYEIWVRCPRCSDTGRVAAPPGQPQHAPRFTCTSCGLKKEAGEKWYGDYQAHLFQACGFCGSDLRYISEPTGNTPEYVDIACENCGQSKAYPVHWRKYKAVLHTDPFFGLELWLQATVKGRTLWVYNREHLEYLRRYVAAKLRDDNSRHKYSMITNLPDWTRSAKNREVILKKLDVLEEALARKTPG